MVVTEGNAFRSLDLPWLRQAMAAPVLVDLRNIYRREEVETPGFS